METNTLISYTEKINNLLPNATIVKLIGYSNGNADYQIAKRAADSWKQAKTLSDDEINYWLSVGGWIGAVIPEGRYLIDIDDPIEGKLLKEYRKVRVKGHVEEALEYLRDEQGPPLQAGQVTRGRSEVATE